MVIIKKIICMFMPVILPFFKRISKMDLKEARKHLECYSRKPLGEAIAENNLREPICDLQIIVPAYNVEKYIENCMESILSQKTKYTYKVILIDDGSTDKTSTIVDRFLSNDNVMVIHQENSGFSGARNVGLENLFGKYIMFVDSDDMLCQGAIDALLDAAFLNDSDIVEGGAFSMIDGTNQKSVYFAHLKKKCLSTAFGTLHGQPWAKVYKAECFKNICFPEGFWFEDSILSFLIYPVKKRICVVDEFIYIYRLNPGGISSTFKNKPKAIDTYWITEMLMGSLQKSNIDVSNIFFEKYLNQLILNQKRLQAAPLYIQESTFVLSVQMMNSYFPDHMINSKRHKKLVKALLENDLGAYRFYCKCC